MKDLNGSGLEAENKTSAEEYISQNPGLQSYLVEGHWDRYPNSGLRRKDMYREASQEESPHQEVNLLAPGS